MPTELRIDFPDIRLVHDPAIFQRVHLDDAISVCKYFHCPQASRIIEEQELQMLESFKTTVQIYLMSNSLIASPSIECQVALTI